MVIDIATPYRTLETGQLATIYAVEPDVYDEHKHFTDYKLSDCDTYDVIFNDNGIPCFYEVVDNQYRIGWDIFTDGIVPIAFQSEGRIIPQAKDNES